MKVTVIVITENNEETITRCLESASWADELVVTDCFSTDSTPDIAAGFTRQFFQLDIRSMTVKRKYSVHKSSNQWVLLLEPYEVITDVLRDEILSLPDNPETHGFQIDIENHCFGRKMKHSGMNPDFQIRLFNRNLAKMEDGINYKGITVFGNPQKLKGTVLSDTPSGLTEIIRKMNLDSTQESLELFENGKGISRAGTIFHAFKAFAYTYIVKMGFLDGLAGFYISFADAATNFLTHLKQLKLLRKI